MPDYSLDASRCVLIVQDLQNDVMIEGGAFAESGAPQHAKDQNVVENVKGLAAFCRQKGIPVIHVWYIVDEGARGLKVNAPLLRALAAGRSSAGRGAAPADRLEAQDGDFVIEKMRMSRGRGPSSRPSRRYRPGHDHRHRCLDEHVDRAHVADGADKGFSMVVPRTAARR
jgi:gluconolactonase